MLAHINYPYISLSPKVGAFTLRFLFIHLPCDTGHENINFSVTPHWDKIEECYFIKKKKKKKGAKHWTNALETDSS